MEVQLPAGRNTPIRDWYGLWIMDMWCRRAVQQTLGGRREHKNNSRAIAGRTVRCRCKLRYVSKVYSSIARFLCHSTAFLLSFFLPRPTSATVQSLKLHKVLIFTAVMRNHTVHTSTTGKPRWSILSTIPLITAHLYLWLSQHNHSSRGVRIELFSARVLCRVSYRVLEYSSG